MPSPPHPPARALLAWYDRHHRDRALPWRAPPGAPPPPPYRVWLSEVMLQQTTAAAVAPRYARFLDRFPTVEALADAPWEAVAEEWAGLGYYARARNLHAAARAVAADHGGTFPDTEDALRALPGVGAYTAAAVAAIAFGRPAVPVDGNVERVASRVFAVREPLPGARPRLAALARGFLDQPEVVARPGDFAQALFDLGATICTPRRPACALCPWREGCEAARLGVGDALPAKPPKAARPERHGTHFLAREAATGRVLLRRRPATGLLGGMPELPGTPWRDDAPWEDAEAATAAHAPLPGLAWTRAPGEARHGFTHFGLTMRLLTAEAPQGTPAPEGGWWETPEAARASLPTVMRAALALADGAASGDDLVPTAKPAAARRRRSA